MARGIHGLSANLGMQLLIGELTDLPPHREEPIRVKEEEELIEPGDKQSLQIIGLYHYFPTLAGMSLLRINEELEHPSGGVLKEFLFRPAPGNNAHVRSVVEFLERSPRASVHGHSVRRRDHRRPQHFEEDLDRRAEAFVSMVDDRKRPFQRQIGHRDNSKAASGSLAGYG